MKALLHRLFSFLARKTSPIGWQGPLLALLLCTSAFAADVETTVGWDANQEFDLAGYRVYYGDKSGEYTQSLDVGLVTTAVIKAPLGSFVFCAVTAYDTAGFESLPSKELSFQSTPRELHKAPSAPKGLHLVKSITVAIERSLDLKIWDPVYSLDLSPVDPESFYRLVVSAKTP